MIPVEASERARKIELTSYYFTRSRDYLSLVSAVSFSCPRTLRKERRGDRAPCSRIFSIVDNNSSNRPASSLVRSARAECSPLPSFPAGYRRYSFSILIPAPVLRPYYREIATLSARVARNFDSDFLQRARNARKPRARWDITTK